MFLTRVACFTTAGLFAGCATSHSESLYAYEDGWRLGTVADIGEAGGVHGRFVKDCRAELPPSSPPARIFARVTYQQARNFRAVIAPVAADSPLRVGDPAYVNVERCDVVGAAPK